MRKDDFCVLLIGNYPLDRQQSMLRFASILEAGLKEAGIGVYSAAPSRGIGNGAMNGLGKWCGYFDKFITFPRHLKRRLAELRDFESRAQRKCIVHICDHSNSMYARFVSGWNSPLVITCHDLGAVRGALGEDTDCPASRTGKVLQSWIQKSLGYADVIACVSNATAQDVRRLVRTQRGTVPEARTILLGQNSSFSRVDSAMSKQRLGRALIDANQHFLLHVGSSLSRKNREGIIHILARIKDRWPGILIFAGEKLPQSAWQLASSLGVRERIAEVIDPSHEVLEALYNQAFALIFPSKFEGFGWPVIEAQACGCPVLCSDSGSLPEVVGDSAFVRSWQAEESFAEEILCMAADEGRRRGWIERGLANTKRFETRRMIADYVQLYSELVERKGRLGNIA